MTHSLRQATKATLNEITIQIAPEFSGRVMVYIRNGQLASYETCLPNVHLATIESFLATALSNGWKVTPIKGNENGS